MTQSTTAVETLDTSNHNITPTALPLEVLPKTQKTHRPTTLLSLLRQAVDTQPRHGLLIRKPHVESGFEQLTYERLWDLATVCFSVDSFVKVSMDKLDHRPERTMEQMMAVIHMRMSC